MRRCPTCRAETSDVDARFCGNCGALLPDPVASPPAAGATDIGPRLGARRWLQVAGVLALLGLVLTAVRLVQPDEPLPVGRPLAMPSTAPAATTWQLDGVVDVAITGDVAPAGAGHVLVGARVVATGGGDPAVRVLPSGGTLDDDGTWAVPDGDTLTLGSLAGGAQATVELDVEGPVTTGPLAWVRGQPVLQDADAHVLLVQRDGSVLWRSEVPVPEVRAVADAWVGGFGDDGGAVAVSLADGSVTELDGAVLAIVGDVAVVAEDATVGRDLASGELLWRRPTDVGEWEVVGSDLVLAGASRAQRIDPMTGETTGEVEGFTPVVVAGGAVVQGNGVLEATGWDGQQRWSVDLEVRATHRIIAVDAQRLAVLSTTGGPAVVTVLAAGDGRELARVRAPAAPVETRLVDGTAALAASPDEVVLVAPDTGEVVAERSGLPPPVAMIATEAGPLTLTVGAARIEADGPFGAWIARPGVPLATPPVPTVARLVVGLADGTVVALDPARGTIQWESAVDGLPTAVAATRDRVAVGTADGRVLLLDTLGTQLATRQLRSPVIGLVAGDAGLVVVTADGDVVGLPLSG